MIFSTTAAISVLFIEISRKVVAKLTTLDEGHALLQIPSIISLFAPGAAPI